MSSTKNNIHHFRAVLKKVLALALEREELSEELYNTTNELLQKATGLDAFCRSYKNPIIREILLESSKSGEFLRILGESEIYA